MQIELNNVVKSYRTARALDDVTVDLGSGITGLLGPNGAGKTTLIRILATLMSPTKGTVRIGGFDPQDARQRLEVRRRLGYLPQELGLYPRFTVFEFVDYIAMLKELNNRRDRHQKVMNALMAVGLEDLARRKIKTLSGGMARRVGIAQALVADPDLMLFDEPTVGLDPEQRARFRELIAGLGQERQVILSTHLVEDVAAICTSVVVLWEGKVLFHGTPAALRAEAEGLVWSSPAPEKDALVSWRTESGKFRVIGAKPSHDATPVDPTVEDGYLYITSAARLKVAA
ncbi:MAG: type transport system ATP-binding protein [Actinomycetota bacterium]|nr:type transport system ATP-binding protein [Actinomycetota bacterium]